MRQGNIGHIHLQTVENSSEITYFNTESQITLPEHLIERFVQNIPRYNTCKKAFLKVV